MNRYDVEIVDIMRDGSYVLRIKNGVAYRIYKTSMPRIKAIFDGSKPVGENKILVTLPGDLIEDFSRILEGLCSTSHGFLTGANELDLSTCAESISTGKSNINDIWVNDNF